MFDKLYRQATDDVPLNAGLLAELKEQARQLDEQKPVNSVKKPVFNIYRYGFVAAALVVAVLGTNIFSSYMKTKNSVANETKTYIEQPHNNDNGNTAVTADEIQQTADEPKKFADIQESARSNVKSEAKRNNAIDFSGETEISTDTAEPVVNTVEEENSVQNTEEPVQTENIGSVAETAEAEDVQAESTSETADFSIRADTTGDVAEAKVSPATEEPTETMPEVDKTASYAKMVSGGGGGASGGGSASAAVVADTQATTRETWSIEEYCSYFGIDVSGIALPGTMASNRSGSADVEKNKDGTVASGQCDVYYVADGKSVSLTFYSDGGYVKAVAAGETISPTASVAKYENGAYTIYGYSGGRGYIAEVFGLSEDEMTALAKSLD